jgi:predicted GNAT superfamily acetyltransferase
LILNFKPVLRALEEPEEIRPVEDLQALVWPGDEREIVPANLMRASVHHGGVLIGAFLPENVSSPEEGDRPSGSSLLGFVFGFPGMYSTPDGPRLQHHSHMLAVHPSYRDQGIGFALKRAQWQMVRRQGIDRITWTYDPLISRNAYLNITRLGAVCKSYLPNCYGEMRDGLNAGLPSDRFMVDWWVNTSRVNRRLSKRPRATLDLAHYLAGGAEVINPTRFNERGLPIPADYRDLPEFYATEDRPAFTLVEIPVDFQELRGMDRDLALAWRIQTRPYFQALFELGYLVTDFIHLTGGQGRAYYVLTYGESTL